MGKTATYYFSKSQYNDDKKTRNFVLLNKIKILWRSRKSQLFNIVFKSRHSHASFFTVFSGFTEFFQHQNSFLALDIMVDVFEMLFLMEVMVLKNAKTNSIDNKALSSISS